MKIKSEEVESAKTKAMMVAFAQTMRGNSQGDAKTVARMYGCRDTEVRKKWDSLEDAERNALIERYGDASKGVVDMTTYMPKFDKIMDNLLDEILERSEHPGKIRDQDLIAYVKLIDSMQRPMPSVKMVQESISDGEGTLVKLRKSIEYQMNKGD